MNFSNKEEVLSLEVRDWLMESIPNLTAYQKGKIRDEDFVRCSGFYFYKDREPVRSPLWRLTILLLPFVFLMLLLSIPFLFLFTGKWGWSKLDWFYEWTFRLGL
jgi:hypothetical protein